MRLTDPARSPSSRVSTPKPPLMTDSRRVWMRDIFPVCRHGSSELSLRGHRNARFGFRLPANALEGESEFLSVRSSALAAFDFMAAYLP
jgi:hypothetical protein